MLVQKKKKINYEFQMDLLDIFTKLVLLFSKSNSKFKKWYSLHVKGW